MGPVKRRVITVVALAVTVLAGCTSASGDSGGSDPSGATATTVAAVPGAGGSLTLVVADTGATLTDGRLTLTGAARATWITDRPVRDAGSYRVGDLAASWADYGFAASPPNAVITGASPLGLPRSIPVVLSSPVAEGTTVTFAISYLAAAPAGLPLDLSSASLVIDGTGSSTAGTVPAIEIQEATNALNQEIQRIEAAQANLQSDWENIGLDIAMEASLDGDFATALDALRNAVTNLSQMADPTVATFDAVLDDAEGAVSTLQTQIQTVLAELDAAERAALAAALGLAL